MVSVDYLIVGSGFTGGTIARILADHAREVLILERRDHLGGNVHDSLHPSNIRVHTYGPHYFRSSSKRIWEFVNRFASFEPCLPVVKSLVSGRFESWPVHRSALDLYPNWRPPATTTPPANFEEACLRKMPRPIYERFIRGYTARQWGLDPRELDARLADRIRINGDTEESLTPQHRHQGLPIGGYARLMSRMLDGIPRRIGVDYLRQRSEFRARKALIFTGPIDEFFGFSEGRLTYRAQRRVHDYLENLDWRQPCVQVNHPDAGEADPVRSVEWKHLTAPENRSAIRGTVVTREYPFSPENSDQFEYPLPTERCRRLHEHYARRAQALPNVIVCGRLGEYRYLDMDQAIARALMIAHRLCGGE